jgi:uncharacterized protein (DUF1330 family)
MAKGYWIGNGDVNDVEAYKKYIEANAEAFREYGAKFLVRGGDGEIQEGSFKSRTVVLEFESYEKALACYQSDAYQKALSIRLPVADMNLLIVAGYDGPQPGDD